MSHAGPPRPDQPDPTQPDQPDQPDPSRPDSGEQPWSPYPSDWDQPHHSGPATPAPYGQPPAPQPPAPYQQGAYPQNPYQPGGAYDAPGAGNPYAGQPRPDRPVFGFGGYASWLSRVGAYLVDAVAMAFAGLPLWIGYGLLVANTTTTTTTSPDGSTSTTTFYDGSKSLPLALIVIGAVTTLAFFVWNICIRQGRTGATIGKSVLAIRLVNADQQPIGPGWAFLRNILHIVDQLPCACLPLGYLWPIWDDKKQTFSDKIMSTYVIHATEQQPRPY